MSGKTKEALATDDAAILVAAQASIKFPLPFDSTFGPGTMVVETVRYAAGAGTYTFPAAAPIGSVIGLFFDGDATLGDIFVEDLTVDGIVPPNNANERAETTTVLVSPSVFGIAYWQKVSLAGSVFWMVIVPPVMAPLPWHVLPTPTPVAGVVRLGRTNIYHPAIHTSLVVPGTPLTEGVMFALKSKEGFAGASIPFGAGGVSFEDPTTGNMTPTPSTQGVKGETLVYKYIASGTNSFLLVDRYFDVVETGQLPDAGVLQTGDPWTAAANKRNRFDYPTGASGNRTVNMPGAPSGGDRVTLAADGIQDDAVNLVVTAVGKPIKGGGTTYGSAITFTNQNGFELDLIYDADDDGWMIQQNSATAIRALMGATDPSHHLPRFNSNGDLDGFLVSTDRIIGRATNGSINDLFRYEVQHILHKAGVVSGTPVGTQNDLVPGSIDTAWYRANEYRWVGASAVTITGFDQDELDTEFVYDKVIINQTTDQWMTLKHLDAGSAAPNRIRCPEGVDFSIGPLTAIRLRYFKTFGEWQVVGRANHIDTGAEQTLTDAATIDFDTRLGRNAAVTLTADAHALDITDARPGQAGKIRIVQGGAGSYTITYARDGVAADVHFGGGGAAPTLSTAIGAVDILEWYDDGTNIHVRVYSLDSQ